MAKQAIKLLSIFLFVFLMQTASLCADTALREEVISDYDHALHVTEDLNIYEDDIFEIIPRLGQASEAIMADDYEKADALLSEINEDFETIRSSKPAQWKRALRLEWLEIYLDIFQKYAFLALLAYILVRFPYYRKQLRTDKISLKAKVILMLLTSSAAIFLSSFDLIKYGKSAWAFLDIQVVLVAVGGLLGGIGVGAGAGLLLACFRWIVNPDHLIYAVIIVGVGILAGFAAKRIKSYGDSYKIGAVVGALAGDVSRASDLCSSAWSIAYSSGFSKCRNSGFSGRVRRFYFLCDCLRRIERGSQA